MRIDSRAKVVCLAAVLGVLSGGPLRSYANARAYHPLFCYFDSSYLGWNGGDIITNNSSGSDSFLFCPVMSDDHLSASAVTTIQAHVYDGNSGSGSIVIAEACIALEASHGGSGSCGTPADTTGMANGYHNLNPSPAIWSAAGLSADYAYLHVVMCPKTTTDTCGFDGYNLFN